MILSEEQLNHLNKETLIIIRSADNYFSLLYHRLHELIYENHIIHADKTPITVIRIDNTRI